LQKRGVKIKRGRRVGAKAKHNPAAQLAQSYKDTKNGSRRRAEGCHKASRSWEKRIGGTDLIRTPLKTYGRIAEGGRREAREPPYRPREPQGREREGTAERRRESIISYDCGVLGNTNRQTVVRTEPYSGEEIGGTQKKHGKQRTL